jgi:hypothetical protein
LTLHRSDEIKPRSIIDPRCSIHRER